MGYPYKNINKDFSLPETVLNDYEVLRGQFDWGYSLIMPLRSYSSSPMIGEARSVWTSGVQLNVGDP